MNVDFEQAGELKIGQVGIANLRVRTLDVPRLVREMRERVTRAPKLFGRAAVILDFGGLSQVPDLATAKALLDGLRDAGVLPVAAGAAPGRMQRNAVRSGQQLYAENCDLTVLSTVGAGAEVIADGSIHIYGTLRGRALAGAQGNPDARIFCRDFHAELVAIAGHYKVLDDVPMDLRGKAVQVWLEQDQIKIAALD